MKGRNSRIVSARVPDEVYHQIARRVTKMRARGTGRLTINAWVLWAIKEGLRDHHNRGETPPV